ncbi:MAG: amino acid oxidase [Gammaproteobacteria bacterium HGW-Gammaproteobacteria-8]|nr:MAG: amino acid oxidase [Gammaproteobacteria bacterium HGW-Gammaproteobacteria-8]
MQPDFEAITAARIEWLGTTPFAVDFGDSYFSREDGPGESMAVFIGGNRLEQRFDALEPGELFVIGETGFGSGLNMLLAAREFARRAPPDAFLALLSTELHPLTRVDLESALEHWPELEAFGRPLLQQYPAACPGFHRIRLAPNIELTLMFGDSTQMWQQQRCKVDAWFLDGFAPDRNPAMWNSKLCRVLAEHSRPGASLASFTVAAAVRDALSAAGFALQRKPGFGRKRHRLEGCMPGVWAPRRIRRGHALVVGAGLAGASSARALAERGWTVTVVDAEGIAAAASGNRAGVVYTTPGGVATPQNRYYQSSYLHALGWFDRHALQQLEIGAFNGVVQHLCKPRKRRRMEQALDSGHWPAQEIARLDDDRVLLVRAGFLQPPAWCRLLLQHPAIEFRQARLLQVHGGDSPRLEFDDPAIGVADATVLCTAFPAPGIQALPLRRIRGQVSEVHATPDSRNWTRAECHEGYLTPAINGPHCVGATFDLDHDDPAPRAADDAANLGQLQRFLPERWRALGGNATRIAAQRVGFRVQARDYLPLLGPVPGMRNTVSELWLNLAHGSRGITGTPLCADLLADAWSGLPGPVDQAIERALDPARFSPLRRTGPR